MTSEPPERLAISLAELLTKIDTHCCQLSNTQQPFGLCTVTPKFPHIIRPTKEIQDDLENRAKEYFHTEQLRGIYLRYWTPPVMPIPEEATAHKAISADDFQLTLQVPQFDKKWQQTVIARNLIYCPVDPDSYEYLDWFELQEEAIRLVPIVHQTVKELEIMAHMELVLHLPAASIFESFIYEYGLTDQHQPMSREACKKLRIKEIKWKDRYPLVYSIIKPAKTVQDLYTIARQKAASSRNPMLKSLFWAFVEHIENNLIVRTQLPEDVKKHTLEKLRKTKKRTAAEKYVAKKRPAISISDIECGQMLYVLIRDYVNTRDNALAEAIFFVWIAQHGAFSGHHLTVDSILSIQRADINADLMTVQIQTKEVYLSEGLKNQILNWLGTVNKKNRKKVFQNITNDSLEDIISKYSQELYGKEGRLCPRDFLEKVHVIPGVRMPLDLRRKIIDQEKLVKDSPYRIKSAKIKNDIKDSIKKYVQESS